MDKRRSTVRRSVAGAMVLLGALGLAGIPLPAEASAGVGHSPAWGELTAAQARMLSRGVDQRVIVVFRNQEPSLPSIQANQARRAEAVGAIQRG